jgi:hypothetical protein
MSYNLEINEPTSKSCQLYYLKYHWEPKHIIGKNHNKINELLKTDGITNISMKDDYNHEYYGILVINGNPNAVNKLKKNISKWLLDCHNMYNGNDIEIKHNYDNSSLNAHGLILQGYEINIEQIIKIPTRFREHIIDKMNEDINLIESKYIKYDLYEKYDNIYDEELKTLSINCDDFMELNNNFPETITHLRIYGDNNISTLNLDYLPNTITHLTLNCEICNLDNLPNSIEYLEITKCYNKNDNINLDNIPNSIRTLKIDDYCVKELNKFPTKLNKIYFDYPPRLNHKDTEILRKENKILKLFHDDFDNNYDEETNKLQIKYHCKKTNKCKFIELIENNIFT